MIQTFFLPRALFFLTAQKPLTFKAARAFLTAMIQTFFLPRALFFLLTTRPVLFFVRSEAFRPPTVFALLPRSTMTLARRPVAMTDFFFMALLAFMAFMAAFFFITFIAAFFFITFMAFIAAAIAGRG